jgi:hypothetical protein
VRNGRKHDTHGVEPLSQVRDMSWPPSEGHPVAQSRRTRLPAVPAAAGWWSCAGMRHWVVAATIGSITLRSGTSIRRRACSAGLATFVARA